MTRRRVPYLTGWEGALPKHRLYSPEIKLEALPAPLTKGKKFLAHPLHFCQQGYREEKAQRFTWKERGNIGVDGRNFREVDGVKRKALRGIEWTRGRKAQRSPFPDLGFINNEIRSEAGPRFQVSSLEADDRLPKATVVSPPEPLPWIPVTLSSVSQT
ncbi:hypothetical protein EDD16DRAFT_1719583 [Pisolithus croceorrhizus]|nr:hypothetical protein EDD16DRAFT_1719583 [Pisolithus croceorrhizus]